MLKIENVNGQDYADFGDGLRLPKFDRNGWFLSMKRGGVGPHPCEEASYMFGNNIKGFSAQDHGVLRERIEPVYKRIGELLPELERAFEAAEKVNPRLTAAAQKEDREKILAPLDASLEAKLLAAVKPLEEDAARIARAVELAVQPEPAKTDVDALRREMRQSEIRQGLAGLKPGELRQKVIEAAHAGNLELADAIDSGPLASDDAKNMVKQAREAWLREHHGWLLEARDAAQEVATAAKFRVHTVQRAVRQKLREFGIKPGSKGIIFGE